MKHLDFHLTQSDPGDTLHHLSLLRAPADAIGPLGTLDEDQLQTHIWAIDASGPNTSVDAMIAQSTLGALADATREGDIVHFAVLSQETWVVKSIDLDQARQERAKYATLAEHPDSMEVTMIYAAARDGRRWRGRRYLTGPQAGQTENVDLLVGPPRRGESQGIAAEQFVRLMVGLR